MSKVFEVAFKLGAELTSSFRSAFSEANGAIKIFGGALAALGGTAALSSLISQVGDMNEALTQLSAQTGIVGEDFEQLKSTAENLFRNNYGDTFDEVTSALANVKQNMHSLSDADLEKFTGQALVFAKTFDEDINEVTRAANNMMSAFGIESSKAMDLFATGAQRGLNFSKEMLDNVSEYAPLFGQMGYTAEEYFGILERGAKAGVYNLDYVNDVMKEFQIRVKDGSKSTSDAMAELSTDTQQVWKEFLKGHGTVADVASTVIAELKNMDDQVLANQIGVGLFGTKWEDLEATAMYAMLGTTEAMRDFQGAMDSINQIQFSTFNSAIRGIGRILFMDLVYPIGDAILPYLNQFANFLSNNLPAAIEKTKSLLTEYGPAVLAITVAFVTFEGVLKSIITTQKIYNTIKALSTKLMYAYRTATLAYTFAGGGMRGMLVALRSAMAALNLTMLANPIGLVIAAIAALTVGLVVAYKTSERFRNVVDKAFSTVKTVVIDTANFIATNAVAMWNGVIESAKALPSKIAEAISGSSIVKALSGLFSNNTIVDGFINSIKVGFSSVTGIISLLAPTITTIGLSFLGVSGPIGIVIGGIVSVIGFLYRLSQTNDNVANALKSAWKAISTAFGPIIDVFKQAFADFVNGVAPQLAQTIEVISASIVALGPSFADLGSTLAEVAVLLFNTWSTVGISIATTVLPLLLQVFQKVFPVIVGLIVSIVPIILELAQVVIPLILNVVQMVFPIILSIIQSVLPIVATLIVAVINVILTLAQNVLPLVLSVVQMVFPIILSILQAVIPIIVAVLQTLVDIINGFVIPAINAILTVVQIVFPYIQMIIQNALAIINGIIQTAMALVRGDWDGAWDAIKSTAETIMDNIITFFQSINLVEVGKSIIRGLINGISSMGGEVVQAISGLVPEPLRNAAGGLLKKFGIGAYADGGIVTRPELAWIGEGGDTEAVIPWNNSQRSKDLWIATGRAIGMLNSSGALSNIQQQIAMRTNSAPGIYPEDVSRATVKKNSCQIVIQYSPQYNVNNPEDLREVQEYAERDKDDLLDRLAEIQRNERRLAFG